MRQNNQRLLAALLLTGLAGSLQAEERPAEVVPAVEQSQENPRARLSLAPFRSEELLPSGGLHELPIRLVRSDDPVLADVAPENPLPSVAEAVGETTRLAAQAQSVVPVAALTPTQDAPAEKTPPVAQVAVAPAKLAPPPSTPVVARQEADAADVPAGRVRTFLAAVPAKLSQLVHRERAEESTVALATGSRPRFADIVAREARAAGVEAALVHAIIAAESGHHSQAVSSKGAAGLMQLMPATARRFGVTNRFSPAQNIRAGTRYIAALMKLFKNDVRLALAAYNAGEGNVLRYGGVPPFAETQRYVSKVLTHLPRMRALTGIKPL